MSEPLSDAELAQLRDALPIVVPSAMEVSLVMTADRWMAITRLVDEVERSRVLLREMEWAGEGGHREEAGCPCCGEAKVSGHKPDCELATLLRR